MKKFTYLVIATAALSMVACTGGNKAGYTITGTVEGASDGDTVYLQEANGRNLTKLDTAVITKGTFTFEVSLIVLAQDRSTNIAKSDFIFSRNKNKK